MGMEVFRLSGACLIVNRHLRARHIEVCLRIQRRNQHNACQRGIVHINRCKMVLIVAHEFLILNVAQLILIFQLGHIAVAIFG